jgi:hypothetical protein
MSVEYTRLLSQIRGILLELAIKYTSNAHIDYKCKLIKNGDLFDYRVSMVERLQKSNMKY